MCELEKILRQSEKPSRYIGGEFLSANKDFDKAHVRVLYAFPDKYEIGISNFGFKILYNIVNKQENFMADRVYAVENDFKNLLIENKYPLYGLESKKSAKAFDIIGFGLQYELAYTTVLKMLEMSDIPVFSKDRNDDCPIIMAGGPCAFNPNPMRKFIDIFNIGDGEDTIIELCKIVEENKGQARDIILKKMSEIEGIYCPKYPKKVKKRVCELKYENHPTKSPIPHFQSVHDRVTVEIRRGCSRLCRFCQSAHTNLSIRERSKEDIVDLTKAYIKNTGYDEYSLLSLSSNDHRDIEEIIETLNNFFKDTGTTPSLPSQRADNFSIKLANLLGAVKKSTITIAPEAGSQRMRNIINKNLTEEQIINAILASVEGGWSKIKLYFMIGLPYETFEDLDAIFYLLDKTNKKCKEKGFKPPKITCSTSIFVPKPFTPFQWCRQNSIVEIEEKIKYLKEKTAFLKNVKINIHNQKLSQIEAFLTRGDEKIADFIYELYKNGSYLDSWDENIDFQKYYETAKKLGLDIEKETTKILDIEKDLPWDFIDCGFSKENMIKGYKKAIDFAMENK